MAAQESLQHHTVQTPPLPHAGHVRAVLDQGSTGKLRAAHPVLHLRALLHAFYRNASWDVLYAHGGLHLIHVLTACEHSNVVCWHVLHPHAGRAQEGTCNQGYNYTVAH